MNCLMPCDTNDDAKLDLWTGCQFAKAWAGVDDGINLRDGVKGAEGDLLLLRDPILRAYYEDEEASESGGGTSIQEGEQRLQDQRFSESLDPSQKSRNDMSKSRRLWGGTIVGLWVSHA